MPNQTFSDLLRCPINLNDLASASLALQCFCEALPIIHTTSGVKESRLQAGELADQLSGELAIRDEDACNIDHGSVVQHLDLLMSLCPPQLPVLPHSMRAVGQTITHNHCFINTSPHRRPAKTSKPESLKNRIKTASRVECTNVVRE
jgi:hypothetical protein